jgi:proteasome activator subunit 4
MKTARYTKLRTFCKTPADLALMRNYNPLQRCVAVEPSRQQSLDFLADFKKPLNLKQADQTKSVPRDL